MQSLTYSKVYSKCIYRILAYSIKKQSVVAAKEFLKLRNNDSTFYEKHSVRVFSNDYEVKRQLVHGYESMKETAARRV